MNASEPGKILAARMDAPLVIGLGDGANFIGSDVLSFLPYTKKVIYLDEGESAILTKENVTIYDADPNLPAVEAQVNYWVSQGFTKSKIVMFAPFYGTDNTGEPICTWADIVNSINPTASEDSLNISSVTSSLYPPTHQVSGGTLFWAGEDYVRTLVDWIKTNSLGGAGFWEVGFDILNDNRSLTQNMYSEFNLPSITTNSLPASGVGSIYNQTIEVSGGMSPYKWSITSGNLDGLTLNSSSGVISGYPTAGGTFSFTTEVTDNLGGTAIETLSITVSSAILNINASSLPNGAVGMTYSQSLSATGGTGPYTWTMTSGTLPAGLALSPNGVISGTPTTAGGPTSVTFQVTDSINELATRSLSVTIISALGIATSSLPNGTVGMAYSQSLSATGGTGPYTWTMTSGTLPAGLALSPNGVISGTPTTAGGPTSITFQVADTMGAMVTNTISITMAYAAWDVNMDGAVNVLDMILISQDFGETGIPGWIREDAVDNGVISVLDLIAVGQHLTG
jgi:hypothetical protein